jgi:hypothetical protein
MGRNEHGDESVDIEGLYRVGDALEDIAFELKLMRMLMLARIGSTHSAARAVMEEIDRYYGGDT